MATAIPVLFSPESTLDEVAKDLRRQGLALSGIWRGRPEAVKAIMIQKDENEERSEALKARIEGVRMRMGPSLIGWPGYKTNPRHSFNPDIYTPARQEFLDGIAARAKADREANPAFIRAQAISATVSASF